MSGLLLLRLAPLAAAAVWVARGEGGDAMVLAALGAAALVVGALRVPRALDLLLLAVVVLGSLGEVLGWYGEVAWYDTAIHVAAPMAGAPIAYVVLARAGVLADPAAAPAWAVVLVCTALGAATGACWEVLEWAADSWTGSALQESLPDTDRDLLADLAGSLLGALALAAATRSATGDA